jgi:hypothetical protein
LTVANLRVFFWTPMVYACACGDVAGAYRLQIS